MLYKALLEPGYLNSGPGARDTDNRVAAHSFKVKHLWVKKATGLGVTEFMLRFMAWLCLRNDDYQNSQMVIVTGPNQELAIKLIKRMKALLVNIVVPVPFAIEGHKMLAHTKWLLEEKEEDGRA